jgi:membrane protein YqaA with SNARE-associated domain
MSADWFEYGYLGLFFASFLAATILPFSSEVILSGMLIAGYNTTFCLLIATFGNWLGGMSSYGLGYLGNIERLEKWLGFKREKLPKFRMYISKYGSYVAFFCWLPFVGDPLAVALGLFRSNSLNVAVWMLLGKAIRYAVMAYSVVYGKEYI